MKIEFKIQIIVLHGCTVERNRLWHATVFPGLFGANSVVSVGTG